MSTAMPQIPPRPARAHDHKPGGGSTLGSEIPKIPPRPANRRHDRSVSPSRESFARSPLNETPFLSNQGNQSKPSLYNHGSANNSSSELPRRPSSVVLPSVGQEGSEYAEFCDPQEELGSSPTQTRNIANDLKLHAPKPSLPVSSAKQRVSAVTRTDSGQAASFGIGKAGSGSDDKDPSSRSLKEKASFASQASNGTERPPSSLESEHGIPEIGQRVPMYPNAGDVQAPSPSVFAATFAPGIGFHNDGTKPRHHGRRTSGRGEIPLDAYGKHGHGPVPHDRFEKAYYEKHPELYKKETGHYHGPFAEGRAEWAMSSDDLNKIVRDTASRGNGAGTAPLIGTPSEQVGFQASEEYASRISSPRPQSSYHVAHSNNSQTHVDSPLKKDSIATEGAGKEEFEKTLSRSLHTSSDNALQSETEDEDTIHVDDPEHRKNKIYGGTSRFESTEYLEPYSEEEEHNDEHGYSAPILAADEVAKEPFGWELQPAVSPLHERRGSSYDDSYYHHRSGSASSLAGSRPTSRPGSRPGSIHGPIPGFRVSDSTPLEDLDEYEPLFPEEERSGHAAMSKKPLTAADKLKRPELKNRKFPSQDIWEDTPNSLQYTATVSTPQLPEDTEEVSMATTPRDETPEQAFARRQEALAEQEATDSDSFLNREKKPWAHKSHLVAETRPELKQRFPSRDIWEDTPSSLQLQTTVAGPQIDEKEILSPPSERPTTGAVVFHQEKAAAGVPLSSEEGRATTGIAAVMKPHIPARPTRSKPAESPEGEKSQPVVPERRPSQKAAHLDATSPPVPTKSKPVIPARPAKPIARNSSENVQLEKTISNSSTKSVGSDGVAAAKPKPPVPHRPIGSKIAALQGGFMSDLNKRLQLGPQAPKKEEVHEEPEAEKEKTPLADARKGRARGPARRAPAAKSPAPSTEAPTQTSTVCGLCIPLTLWQIDPDEGLLSVPSIKEESTHKPETNAAHIDTPTLATNITGEDLHAASVIAPSPAKDVPIEAPTPILFKKEQETEKVEESRKEEIPTAPDIEKEEPSEEAPRKAKAGVESDLTDDEEERLSGSTATLKADDEVVE